MKLSKEGDAVNPVLTDIQIEILRAAGLDPYVHPLSKRGKSVYGGTRLHRKVLAREYDWIVEQTENQKGGITGRYNPGTGRMYDGGCDC